MPTSDPDPALAADTGADPVDAADPVDEPGHGEFHVVAGAGEPGSGVEPGRATFVDLHGMRLRVWEWGDPDGPPVFCSHGAYDHGRMFDDLAPRLAALGYHVRAIDIRGHGDSGRISGGGIFEGAVVDLAQLARTEGRPVGLVGHSMGGVLSMQLAAVFPELVRWVVDIDGFGPPAAGFDPMPPADQARTGWAILRRVLERGPRVFADRDAMADQRGALNGRLPRRWVEHLVEHGSRRVDDGWIWKWDPLFSTGLPMGFGAAWAESDFGQVRAPVMMLSGGAPDMWTFPASEVEGRLACFTSSAYLVHHRDPDAGHYLHLERPEATFERIRAFLAEVDAAEAHA
jgi:pimeloyl-ACP methyl ester carboxylesterase